MAAMTLTTAAGWPAQASSPGVVVPGGDGGPGAAGPGAQWPQRLEPDLLIVSQHGLPAAVPSLVQQQAGVAAAEPADAAAIMVNGKYTQMLGVTPATFRFFAAQPTAEDARLWRNVSNGQIAVSYTMGKHDKLPVGGTVQVAGRQRLTLHVAGLGTVGIAGVDAVVSRSVAATLGFPQGNAILVSATRHADMTALSQRLGKVLPKGTAIEVLAAAARKQPDTTAGAQGGSVVTAGADQVPPGAALTPPQILAMLKAAVSRVGMPYVWGGSGPLVFDCSGLVQWSFAQAGIAMPRVAADQARTGPAVTVAQLQPGDLLFYHTDPTAPGYISHVAIYLGRGEMIQAPEPGMNVEIVPLALGPEFAGAVSVAPAVARQVAGAIG